MIWQLLTFVFPTFLYGVCTGVEIEPCFHAVKNEPCNMTCRVPDFTEVVQFHCNGSSRGACTIFGCSPNMIEEGGNTVILQIPSMSYSNDACEWTCTYGATSSPATKLIIYSGISDNINLSSRKHANGVRLTATADCLYPYNPVVNVQYREQTGGQFSSLNLQISLQSSTSPGACNYNIEKRLTATAELSGSLAVLSGKTVFFRMTYAQYPSAGSTSSNEVGPFSFQSDIPFDF